MSETLEARQERERAAADSTSTLIRGDLPTSRAGVESVDPGRSISPSVSIGAGCAFEGLLSFRGETRIDGDLVGEVVASGTLRLGESARVRARIEVDELIVEGELEGDVVARRRLELSATARVRGSLQAGRFSLADGCLVQGRLRSIP